MNSRSTALLALLFTGCAGGSAIEYAWQKPEATRADLQRDRYECFREASMVPQVARPSGPPPSLSGDGGFAEGFRRGRAVSAYHDAVAQSEEQELKAQALFQLCMSSRGWQFSPVSSPALNTDAQSNWILWQRGPVAANVVNAPLPAWSQHAGFRDRPVCDQARDAFLAQLAGKTPDFSNSGLTLKRVERAPEEGAVRFVTTKVYRASDGERRAEIIFQYEALCRPASQGPPTS